MTICSNCGEQVEDDQKICAHCGEALKISKSMKIFVPIDFSEVREALPQGEDIIYSTYCSAQMGWVDRASYKTETFQSHVLLTKNGIAYQEPTAGLIKSNYLPWPEVANLGIGMILFSKGKGTKLKSYHYTMTPVSKYESLQDFEMRTSKFFFDFFPHLIEEKIKHRSKDLKKIQKLYDKLKTILGEEEFEFFRTNNDYEEFNKHLPLLEDAMVKAMPKWAQFALKRINK
jgi:hypothetical protein